jgi:ribosome recycling factor
MAFDFSQFHLQTQKALDHLTQELSTLRTGRASTQLLDPVVVLAYGTQMKLNEVANLSTPDPHLLMVAPWDKSLLADIEKAIISSGLNLSPVVDGAVIRIPIPPLTQERRQEMVKLLHQKIESGRVMIRSIRTETKKDIEKREDTPGVSEDMIKADVDTLEKKTKELMDKLDQMAEAKEAELLKV